MVLDRPWIVMPSGFQRTRGHSGKPNAQWEIRNQATRRTLRFDVVTGPVRRLPELSRLGGFGEFNALRTLWPFPVGLHYSGVAAAACAAVILGGGWAGRSSLSRSSSSVSSGSGSV